MSESTMPKIITVDGVEYEVEKLSDAAKRLLAIYAQWEQDVIATRLVLAKNEAALRDLTRELSVAIKEQPEAPAA